VSDVLAGKMMRCPGCGNEIPVSPSAPGKGKGKGKAGGNPRQGGPAFEISGGQKILIGVIVTLLVLGGVFYFGPVRVWNQWSDLQPKASANVQDLVIDSLREKMKEEDPDPAGPRRQPTVESHDVSFLSPYFAFSMPEEVGFIGKSNQGTFTGTYNTRTGQVDATVSFGGYTVAGMVDLGRPRGSFHLVGRMVNDKPEMEMDGKKI
jgi:hypothetical protein